MKRGPSQIALAMDFLLNALAWGDAHHTISARTGYALSRGKLWAKFLAPLIDRLFSPGHCLAQARAEGLIT